MKRWLLFLVLLPAGGCMTSEDFFYEDRLWFDEASSCPCSAGVATQSGRIVPVPATGITPTSATVPPPPTRVQTAEPPR